MKKQLFYLFLLTFFLIISNSYTQEIKNSKNIEKVTKLFKSQEILPIKLSYSNKDIKRNTNDSTFIKTDLSYKQEDGSWKIMEVELRRRGNNRLDNCYFPPVKIKIKKSISKGTLFKGNKKLKLVLPCLKQKNMNDNVIKECMAYKLYEIISPYHFKTRMVTIDFTETRGKKTVIHKLEGFLIEDNKKISARHSGKILKRFIHPLEQDAITSVQNAFFQYMIANTDYSTAYQHNEKLFFIDNKIIPVPYDFDMSGLVDASYAVVSQIQNETLEITDVTQRMYRGFKRDEKVFQQVRKEFLDNKIQMFEIVDSFKSKFDNPKEFAIARKYIEKFFAILENSSEFRNKIISAARTK